MKVIITESKLNNIINSTLGYNLSDKIDMISSFWDADITVRSMIGGKERFNKLLNLWGPMYWIKTPNNGEWLAQQRENREWTIRSPYLEIIDESELLSYMGLNVFGIPLNTIINNFVIEED